MAFYQLFGPLHYNYYSTPWVMFYMSYFPELNITRVDRYSLPFVMFAPLKPMEFIWSIQAILRAIFKYIKGIFNKTSTRGITMN